MTPGEKKNPQKLPSSYQDSALLSTYLATKDAYLQQYTSPRSERLFRSVVFYEVRISIPPIRSITDCGQHIGVRVIDGPICVSYRPNKDGSGPGSLRILLFWTSKYRYRHLPGLTKA